VAAFQVSAVGRGRSAGYRQQSDLQAAEASLRQSQDKLRAGYGVFFPQVQADAAASRKRVAPADQA